MKALVRYDIGEDTRGPYAHIGVASAMLGLRGTIIEVDLHPEQLLADCGYYISNRVDDINNRWNWYKDWLIFDEKEIDYYKMTQ